MIMILMMNCHQQKKIRKDSAFCESDSGSIHADDDDHHSLDGEKKALLEE